MDVQIVYSPAPGPAAAGFSVSHLHFEEDSPGSAATGTTSDITFSAVPFGTAAADRDIYVFVGAIGADSTVAGITIGGVSATVLETYLDAADSNMGLYKARITSGTSGDIVVDVVGNTLDTAISVWRATGVTAERSNQYRRNTSTGGALDINTATGGHIIACALGVNNTGQWSWTGITERSDQDIRTGEYFSEADAAVVTGETPRSVSNTTSPSGSHMTIILALDP